MLPSLFGQPFISALRKRFSLITFLRNQNIITATKTSNAKISKAHDTYKIIEEALKSQKAERKAKRSRK